jgi:hypothetical protein
MNKTSTLRLAAHAQLQIAPIERGAYALQTTDTGLFRLI